MISASRHPLALTLCGLAALVLAACGGSVSSPDSDDAGSTGGASGAGGAAGTGGGAAGIGGSGGNTGCYANGQWYKEGDSFKSDCNTCQCHSSGQISCTAMACYDCSWQGSWYYAGDTYPAGDGCNTCTCMAGGASACTEMACSGCVYAGQHYKPGEGFPALDGCNKCECTDQGVSCTDMACACDPAKEWWRNYVAHSPEECSVIDYVCPPNTFGFSNACGCGCEQDSSCPEYISCMPPAPNCEADKAKCPFSGVAL